MMSKEQKAEMVDALRDAIGRIENDQITDCIFVGVPAESGPYPRVLVAKMGGGLALVGACVQAQRVASHSGYGEPETVRLGHGDI